MLRFDGMAAHLLAANAVTDQPAARHLLLHHLTQVHRPVAGHDVVRRNVANHAVEQAIGRH